MLDLRFVFDPDRPSPTANRGADRLGEIRPEELPEPWRGLYRRYVARRQAEGQALEHAEAEALAKVAATIRALA